MNRSSLVFVATFELLHTTGVHTKTRPFWNLDGSVLHTEFARFVQEVYTEPVLGAEFSIMLLTD